ncbi:hypothetical protein [Pedobacter sp. V48]|uniref:hypothetical protein n=1 Tax=Pedobacter sp. V48 TaxID=509635 RepID=UPI001268A644|nr:hypothetical protein [Pedobacter sp. V48]
MRKSIGWSFGLLFIFSFIVLGITSARKPKNSSTENMGPEMGKELNRSMPLSAEDKIRMLIKKQLDGKNNSDLPYLREMTVTMENMEASVVVRYNHDQGPNANFTKDTIGSRMSKLYFELYKSKLPIKYAVICAYLPLLDRYGEISPKLVFTTYLDKTAAAKINWSLEDSRIKRNMIPQVWKVLFSYPIPQPD